ncbi:MAG TPA: HEAT repeat domain-containing protein [Candidatus Binataceae bacterium]|nr:HEAT repeat domain-containing protein [Candidatus Binataceae bacterium]
MDCGLPADPLLAGGPGATAAIPGLVEALRDGDRGAAADVLAAIGKPAVPALLAALHNPDLYTREGAVTALSKSKPLPDEVARALIATASDDKSIVVRYEAANVLDRAGIEGGHAALEKAQQQMDAAMTEPPAVDTKRLYRRQEIFADIPPDDNHEYPLRLIYLFSFNAPRAEMLAAVYRGPDRRDRLIFWRQSGDDRYQQMQAIDAGPDASDTFDPPKVIFILKGQVPGLGVRFVDVGVNLWRGHGDYVFALDGDELRPVEIESPEQWYRDKLQPGEEIVSPSENSFYDREARFRFLLRSGRRTEQVAGSYKVVREAAADVGLGTAGMFGINGIKDTVGNSLAIWKLAVDNARRGPIPRTDE